MAGGIFSKANRPKRPGSFFNFEGVAPVSIPTAAGSIVAIPFTHDWGPFKVPRRVGSFAEFVSVYGPTKTTQGARAVQMAFRGEGAHGRNGAGAVVCYRFGSSAAAKATKVLNNTAAAPAITLTARYEGSYGNNLRVTTQDWLTDPAGGTSTQNELILYDGTVEVERYRYVDTDITSLAAQINATSGYVTAGSVTSGTALAVVTSSAFAGGADGDTAVTGGDMTAVRSALEAERFGLFAWPDLSGQNFSGTTTAAELAATKAWATTDPTTGVPGLNQKGKRFTVVFGGAAGESLTTAFTARGTQLNDPNIVTLAMGTYTDTNIRDAAGALVQLSSSQLAPRLAGILASRGQSLSATGARLGGTDMTLGPTETEILRAFDFGFVVLSKDSDSEAPLKVEKALTTYVTTSNAQMPYLVFRNPKFVLTMQAIETELSDYANSEIIGLLPVTNATREALVGEMRVRLQQRADAAIIQQGFTVGVDQDPPPSDNDEFVALVYGVKFGRSIEQVFHTVRVG